MPVVDRRSLFLALGAAALPLPVFGAEPWDKEFSQWSEKDIQRVMTDSPWAKNAAVPLNVGGPPSGGGGGKGGRGRGGGGGGGGSATSDASAGSGGSDSGMGGMGGSGGGGGMGAGDMGPSGVPTANFLIRWQSAAPVKAAMVRAKLGKEADSSPQAKAFIEKEEETYVIAMVTPPTGGRGGADRKGPASGPDGEALLLKATTLSWKGHEGLHPVKIIMPKENSTAFVFHFPKTHPIELEDKDVAFASVSGTLEVRKKFKLKDMVYQGKLAL